MALLPHRRRASRGWEGASSIWSTPRGERPGSLRQTNGPESRLPIVVNAKTGRLSRLERPQMRYPRFDFVTCLASAAGEPDSNEHLLLKIEEALGLPPRQVDRLPENCIGGGAKRRRNSFVKPARTRRFAVGSRAIYTLHNPDAPIRHIQLSMAPAGNQGLNPRESPFYGQPLLPDGPQRKVTPSSATMAPLIAAKSKTRPSESMVRSLKLPLLTTAWS